MKNPIFDSLYKLNSSIRLLAVFLHHIRKCHFCMIDRYLLRYIFNKISLKDALALCADASSRKNDYSPL